jgi:hypothetical protein
VPQPGVVGRVRNAASHLSKAVSCDSEDRNGLEQRSIRARGSSIVVRGKADGPGQGGRPQVPDPPPADPFDTFRSVQLTLFWMAIASIEIRRPLGKATLAGADRAGGGSGMWRAYTSLMVAKSSTLA